MCIYVMNSTILVDREEAGRFLPVYKRCGVFVDAQERGRHIGWKPSEPGGQQNRSKCERTDLQKQEVEDRQGS